MKLILDMNLSPRWVARLAEAGIDATHWSSLGLATAPDLEIMQYARKHAYVVMTHDLDFSAILAATQGEKPSVVQLRTEDVSPEAIGSLVVQALQQTEAELEAGALLTLDTRRSRLKILPLRS